MCTVTTGISCCWVPSYLHSSEKVGRMHKSPLLVISFAVYKTAAFYLLQMHPSDRSLEPQDKLHGSKDAEEERP